MELKLMANSNRVPDFNTVSIRLLRAYWVFLSYFMLGK